MAMGIKINFTLLFGNCNGYMSAKIYTNKDLLLKLDNFVDPVQKISLDINFPSVLIFDITGKNMLSDTKLDDNNNIVEDKFIKIKELTVGYLPVNDNFLPKICKFTTKFGEVTTSDFWHTNGRVLIEFDEPDFIKWHLKLRKNN